MRFKFSIMKKIVSGITVVSTVTYGTSAFFILVVKDFLNGVVPDGVFMLITFALGVFWTGFLGMLAAKWFVKPLQQLMESANQVSDGNLNIHVIPSRSDDELRALSVSFEKMLNQLKRIVDGILENYKVTDTHVDELRAAIGQATHHIEHITNRVEYISSGAEHQSHSAKAMFQSVEQMTQATDEINSKAHSARLLTKEMDQTIEESEGVIRSLVEGMQRLADLNRQSMEVVRRLDDYAVHIGEISNVVGDIAGQTQLLALNASIEAARAGEEGRGFAVVADAVKKLAVQSEQSVEDIRQLIAQIQLEIKNVVTKISEQSEVAEKESAHGEKSATALRNIANEADKVIQIVDSISLMVAAQNEQMNNTLTEARDVADIAAQISLGAHEVFSSTQEQNAVMEEIAASSDLLKEHSVNLKQKIVFFKN